MRFQSTMLDNGLTIIGESNPHALSTAIGFFVKTGSRDETPELAGVSHFLEHMAFKGTETRTTDDINQAFDDIGAKYNAYTSEEHTVYHAAILPEYLPACIDLLADLLTPTLRPADFDTERDVIIEEIGMYEDSPMWSAYDHVIKRHFIDHPLGNIILGTKESIRDLTVDAMARYHALRYCPSNILVAAAGQFDFDHLSDLVRGKCEGWKGGKVERSRPQPTRHAGSDIIVRPEFTMEMVYMMADAPAANDPMRVAADILTVILGDDTGSRFYWALSDPGEVESVEMSYHEYEGAGAYIIGLACDPPATDENIDVVRKICHEIAARGVSREELDSARSKVLARLVIAGERPQNRLFPVGYNWTYRDEYRTLDEDIRDVEAVTIDDIHELLRRFPLKDMTTVCLGPLEKCSSL